nr:amidohydrolase family protein [Spirochaetota bacterium]
GGGVLFYELMPEVRKAFARVYYDTAASPLIYDNRIYASAVSLVGSGKIILGSDYPLTGFARYIAPIKKLTDARDRDTILRDNARRVLGLIE